MLSKPYLHNLHIREINNCKQDPHLNLVELLSIVQALNTDLQELAFAPCPGRVQALPRFQRADSGVELRAQACAWSL